MLKSPELKDICQRAAHRNWNHPQTEVYIAVSKAGEGELLSSLKLKPQV